MIAIPVLLSGIATTTVVYSNARTELKARSDHFGKVIAAQLSLSVTDPLIQGDPLSLNVIVNELSAKGDFDLVSVYSADSRLLAQAGRNRGDLAIFTHDIVFQDTTAGYVQLGLAPSSVDAPLNTIALTAVIIHVLVLSLLSVLVWFYGDLVYGWLAHRTVTSLGSPLPEAAEAEHATHTLLVIKVNPLRQLEAHREKIVNAVGLYRGDVDLWDSDDIVVTYRTADQLLQAMLSAALVQTLTMSLRCSARCGIHLIASDAGDELVANARKHATHLASISEDKILMSRPVYEQARELSQVTIDEYHSSLTREGEVYFLTTLSDTNRDLIQRQARQFI